MVAPPHLRDMYSYNGRKVPNHKGCISTSPESQKVTYEDHIIHDISFPPPCVWSSSYFPIFQFLKSKLITSNKHVLVYINIKCQNYIFIKSALLPSLSGKKHTRKLEYGYKQCLICRTAATGKLTISSHVVEALNRMKVV